MIADTFSLPQRGRVVVAKRRPGGGGQASSALYRPTLPTRLSLRVSHPPRAGEGER
jgi:hypothetical protein